MSEICIREILIESDIRIVAIVGIDSNGRSRVISIDDQEFFKNPVPRTESALDKAIKFVEGRLKTGMEPAKELMNAAIRNGMSTTTLQRAKKILNVIVFYRGGVAFWALERTV